MPKIILLKEIIYYKVFLLSLQKFHFSFNANKSKLLCRSISVVKEKFFSGLNISFGKNANSMITIDHQNFGATIGVDGMIGKADLISLSCGINNIFIVEIEKEAAHVFVINFPSSVCFILRDNLSTIFRNELVLVGKIFDEDSPAGNIRGSHQQLLPQPALNHHVTAGDLGHVVLVRPTARAQVGVTLTHGEETRTLLRGALSLAPTPGEPVLTISGAKTKLFAKI